jgi:CRISPR-associated protein Cas2
MRKVYIVSYDVCCPKRLRKVFKTMRGWGDHLQLSVFRCELNPRELVELRAALSTILHHGEDQVMLVDVGPVEGRGHASITTMGKPYMHPEHHALVL